VVEVYALIGKLSNLEIDTEDTVEMILKFANGIFGTIHLDYVSRMYVCHLTITGDQGTVLWEFQTHKVRWYTSKDKTWQSIEWLVYDINSMYVEEMRHFLGVLQGKEVSQLDVHRGKEVLKIALAAARSAREKRAVSL